MHRPASYAFPEAVVTVTLWVLSLTATTASPQCTGMPRRSAWLSCICANSGLLLRNEMLTSGAAWFAPGRSHSGVAEWMVEPEGVSMCTEHR